MVMQTERLSRQNIASGFNIDWTVHIGRDGISEDPVRVRLKVWAWKYRQSSYGAPTFTGTAVADHDHGAVETDGVDAVPGAHQTLRTYPGSGVNSSLLCGVAAAGQAAVTIRTDGAGAHTPAGTVSNPGAAMNEDTAPNANLDILIDGASYKTGLGDGTEKLLVDELITDKMGAGDHTIRFSIGANGAIEALLAVEY